MASTARAGCGLRSPRPASHVGVRVGRSAAAATTPANATTWAFGKFRCHRSDWMATVDWTAGLPVSRRSPAPAHVGVHEPRHEPLPLSVNVTPGTGTNSHSYQSPRSVSLMTP